MPASLPVTFAAGPDGLWRIDRILAVRGEAVTPAARLAIHESTPSPQPGWTWWLHGVTSHLRYTRVPERADLAARQPALGHHFARRLGDREIQP